MSMSDMFMIVVGGFVAAISILFIFYVFNAFNTDPNIQTVFAANKASTVPIQQGLDAVKTMDYGMALFIFVAGLTSIALAAMVRSHPLFFMITFLFQIFLVMISAILSNVFGMLTSSAMLSSITGQFPITMMIFGAYFPLIVLVISSLIAIAQYATPGYSGAANV